MEDELARIERLYGSVAEYNRCKWEEDVEYYEPTDEEIAESERQLAEYRAEIKRLNGTESEFVRNLVSEWEKSKPKDDGTNASIYATYDWAKARTLAVVQQIADYYKVSIDEEWGTFYRPPEGKFAIKVEYKDSCYIKSKCIGNLDLEQFKAVFRDLYYARLSPSMSYKGRFVGNCSLGELLRNYIK
jgi:hypothetical protein